ncbi:dehydrogenase [Rhodothalassium salexigens]|uniref:SDR family NAD(P)-dependent oxidoreductase n=1 Tax=Rhodothalassium salexigens TaxID=1086 RepID=UPI00191364B4|nr:SDR family NAD(P)-dependent oxidoreductase [Rhodothalassium salexigens]MBK5910972.1 dehydrogenase [Rhodothalassium salexigens]MBK5921249.1 dehydrogenase [Rhodothalassium salexigens]
MDYSGKVALITGAARGIGRACAQAFASQGAQVALVDIDGEAVRAAAHAIEDETGRAALAIPADLGQDDAPATAVARTVERFGALSVLVNNAAIMAPGSVVDLSADDFDRVLRVNLRAAYLMSRTAANHMIAAGHGGAIVNMSSINAQLAIPDQVAYVTAKGGLAQMTKAAALALAPHAIRVNAVAPGSIDTDILRGVMADPAARRTVLSRTPLGRIGRPSEVAQAVLFLASDRASYITGTTLTVDGGRSALNYTVAVDDGA